MSREIARASGIACDRLRRGQINEEGRGHETPLREFSEKIVPAAKLLGELPIHIDATGGLKIPQLVARARRRKRIQDTRLIVVDYLQLMSSGKRADNRAAEVGEITVALKTLAKELHVPVIALSQLSREVEKRADKRPQLSDLRESGCLAGDTLVVDPKTGARRRIDEMAGNSPGNVLSINESTLKIEASPVSRGFCTGTKPVCDLVLETGRKITATANHRFLTQDGWLRLDQITSDHYLATPRKVAVCTASDGYSMSQDELALLAHMIGDGCALPRHAVQYTCGERELAELVAEAARRVFGESIVPRISAERTWYQVYLPAAQKLARGRQNPLAAWFERLGIWGKRAHEKFVPEAVFQQGEPSIAHFLSHLWATDGHVGFRKDGRMRQPTIFYSTSSERLARDVQSLLIRLGIVGILRRTSCAGKGRDSWAIHISGQSDTKAFLNRISVVGAHRQAAVEDIKVYLDKTPANVNRDIIPASMWAAVAGREIAKSGMAMKDIGTRMGGKFSLASQQKQNYSRSRLSTLANALSSTELSDMAASDLYWDRVKSVKQAGEAKVYDLTVPGNQNFVANDIVAHNSIEQDADIVLFVYREEYYLSRMEPQASKVEEHLEWQASLAACRGLAEIVCGKQRHGPIGTIKMQFQDSTASFWDLDSRHGPALRG